MADFAGFKFRARVRARRFCGMALLFAMFMASCCPPALMDRAIKKNEKPPRAQQTKP